jgi:hypothetical protein
MPRGLRDRDAGFQQLTVAVHAAKVTARGEPATPEPQPGTGAPPSEPADGGIQPQTGQPKPPERPEDSDGPYSRQKTPCGRQRADDARLGDTHRQVGDSNRIAQEDRVFTDGETWNTIHLKGNFVVITDSRGRLLVNF